MWQRVTQESTIVSRVDWRNRANLSLLGRLAGRVLDVLYPGVCAVCRRFCDGAGPLCDACQDRMRQIISEPACERCAKPIVQQGAPCPWCLGRGMYPFERIERLAKYQEPLSSLIQQMKYEGKWPLGEVLAEWLLKRERVRAVLEGADCVLAVPLHWRRQFVRGYNQAEVVARYLANERKIKRVGGVKRVRDTETQTQLHSRQARYANVRGAFSLIDGRAVQGKRVVVVDDVMTSGATLQAVGRALLKAKPAAIYAIVLAVADPKGRDFTAI
ncbi:MAG: ComF family protein [Bacillota bacterium]